MDGVKKKLSSLYKRYIHIVPGVRIYLLLSLLVLALGITITIVSWYVDVDRVENQKQARTIQQATDVENGIRTRLGLYEQILRGGRGVYEASDSVSREEWRRFVLQYDIPHAYPGLNRVGFIQHVRGGESDQFAASVRNEGFPDYKITPPGPRAEYALVHYLEPFDNSLIKSLGFDILTDPDRRKPVEQARDSGQVAVSEKTVLVVDRGTNRLGYTMYMPVYMQNRPHSTVEERRANIQGYIVAGFRAEVFLREAVDKNKFTTYSDIQVFDGLGTEPNELLYETANFNNFKRGDISQPFTVNVFDKNWTYRFAGPAETSRDDRQRSTLILIGGITISFAISGFLFLAMLTRVRAIVYAKQKEAQQAKDDLLSLASHQLRTPATAVKQYLGMILEGYIGKVNEKQLPALQKAYSSNERQLDTINQILYVAKADAGRLSIHRYYFDINKLIDEIALDLAETFEESEQSLIVRNDSGKELEVYADESSIRMVIENLISNAVKYSYADSEILVESGKQNNEVYVSVTDYGVGIAPRDFDKLFKKFSRIENVLSLQVGGSGIGLYIDKVLIELHGGRIEVKSKLGKGSTFTIFLPQPDANNLTDEDQKSDSV